MQILISKTKNKNKKKHINPVTFFFFINSTDFLQKNMSSNTQKKLRFSHPYCSERNLNIGYSLLENMNKVRVTCYPAAIRLQKPWWPFSPKSLICHRNRSWFRFVAPCQNMCFVWAPSHIQCLGGVRQSESENVCQ